MLTVSPSVLDPTRILHTTNGDNSICLLSLDACVVPPSPKTMTRDHVDVYVGDHVMRTPVYIVDTLRELDNISYRVWITHDPTLCDGVDESLGLRTTDIINSQRDDFVANLQSMLRSGTIKGHRIAVVSSLLPLPLVKVHTLNIRSLLIAPTPDDVISRHDCARLTYHLRQF